MRISIEIVTASAMLVAGLMSGCRTQAQTPAQAPASDAPAVRFVTGEFARGHAKQSRPVAMPFQVAPGGTNGTALVLGYLERAGATGARYVSDMAVYFVFDYRGEPVECKSQITVDTGIDTAVQAGPGPESAPAGDGDAPAYSSAVAPFELSSAVVRVTENEYRCHDATSYQRMDKRRHDSRVAAEVWRFGQYNPMESSFEGKKVQECRLEPVTRTARRYAHHVALEFTPPNWEYIGKQFSDWPLAEGEPQCYRITAQQRQSRGHRIAATVSFVGMSGERPLPEVLEAGFRPWAPRRGATPKSGIY